MVDNVVPLDTVKAVIERRNAGMKNPSVEINTNGDIIPRRSKYTAVSAVSEASELDRRIRESARYEPGSYTVSVRPSTRAGPPEQSSRAIKLKACGGKKGCEFVQCVEDAMGKVPKNLQKLKEGCQRAGASGQTAPRSA